MPKRRPHRTRRTQARLVQYAQAMGYTVKSHHKDHVTMHREEVEVNIPSTSDTTNPPTQMSKKVWHDTYKALFMGAM